MRKTLMVVVVLSCSGMGQAAPIPPTISVFTTLAPNAFGSPSFPGWQSNAVNAMMNGAVPTGTVGTPEYFQTQGNVLASWISVTSFPSWMGTADPGTVFGPGFAAELGNRGTFPLFVDGNGGQFSISQLGFSAVSSDPGNVLGFSFGTGSYNYGPGYVGIQFGGNGVLGGGDDILITGGLNTQLVDALAGRGSGNALWPCGPGDLSPCSTIPEKQAAINAMTAILGGETFTGTYTLGGVSGSATFNVAAVPEPATFAVMGLGLLGLLLAKRRCHR